MGKSFLLSKTLWANIVALLALFLDSQELVNLYPSTWTPYIAGAIALINGILRIWTVEPVQMRAPQQTPRGLR